MENNLVYNGDFTLLPPDPLVHTTTSLRYINGKSSGAFSDAGGWGWYFADEPVNGVGAKAGFVKGGYHYGGNGLEMINTTDTAKGIVSSRKFPVRGNTAYKLTFAVELENVPTNGVYIKVNYWNAGATVANAGATTPKQTGSAKCKLVEFNFTTWPGTANVTFELRNIVPGRFDTNNPAPSRVIFHDLKLVENADLVEVPLNAELQYGSNAPFDIAVNSFSSVDFAGYCDKMKALGLSQIRASFVFPYIHNTPGGQYIWTAYDRFVSIARSKGMDVIPILSYPSANDDFADYFRTVVAHFKPMGIRYYELWNEKNLNGIYNNNNDPAYYASLLKVAYPAIKEADPTAKVLFSGLTVGSIGQESINDPAYPEVSAGAFLRGFYAAGGGNYFDIMNLHPYGHVDGAVQEVKRVLFENGDETKQLWFTEDGIPTGGKSGQAFTDQAGQAAYCLAAIDFAKKYSAARLFFYNGNDSNGAKPDREGYFGLMSGNLNALVPKQAYTAVQNVINPQ